MSSRPAFFLALAAVVIPGGAAHAAKFNLKMGATGQVCFDCHSDFQDQLKKPFVHTPVKSKECTGCHSPHASEHGKLLAGETTQVCLACHSDIVPKAAKSSHKPIAEKGCTTCHDPHASAFKFNLVKAGNELCAGCHKPIAETAAKAKFKHRPVEQGGCTTCHNPHGSGKAGSLLKSDVPDLCVSCHKVDKPIFAKQHQNYPVAKARCTGCHDPHGSDKRGMLYNRVHPPVAKAMCAQCHEAAGSPNPLRTRQQGVALCRGCHSQKVVAINDKSRVHRPVVEGAACLNCHNPHASPQPGLLKGKGGMVSLCGKCHADSIKRQELSPTKHDPVRDGSCTSCHDPHSSENPLMFVKADMTEMCGTCHDWLKHSSHPMGEKFNDPRNKNLKVQCVSCHRAHGTEYKHLIPYPTTTDLCTKCHERFKR